jgi:hypothetical protein
MNKVLSQVNDILAKLDQRLTALEEAQKAPKTTTTRKTAEPKQ